MLTPIRSDRGPRNDRRAHPGRAPTEEKSGARRNRERPPAPEPLPHPVVDNHCHLDIADGDDWLAAEDAIAAARAVGVARIVQIGCDLPGCAVGGRGRAHPRRAGRRCRAAPQRGAATGRRRDPRRGPGGDRAPRAGARQGARRRGDRARPLPHRRGGAGGAGRVLPPAHRPGQAARQDAGHPRPRRPRRGARGARQRGRARALGDALLLRRRTSSRGSACDRGAYLSFAGTVTFKNAAPLRDALAVTPRDRVLVETDAPFLTPTPYRGRPNASYLVPLTMRAMAEVRGRRPRRAVRGGRRRTPRTRSEAPGSPITGRSRPGEPGHFRPHLGLADLAEPPGPSLWSCDCWPGSGTSPAQRQVWPPPAAAPYEPPCSTGLPIGESRAHGRAGTRGPESTTFGESCPVMSTASCPPCSGAVASWSPSRRPWSWPSPAPPYGYAALSKHRDPVPRRAGAGGHRDGRHRRRRPGVRGHRGRRARHRRAQRRRGRSRTAAGSASASDGRSSSTSTATTQTHWVTSTDVAAALGEIGERFLGAELSTSRGAGIDRDGMALEVVTPKKLEGLRSPARSRSRASSPRSPSRTR